ncbi:MAG: HAMP domain-containing sensor histidine kinase [Clostridia bacterium]
MHSIRNKLFYLIFGVLFASLLLTYLFGSQFSELFYEQSKKQELSSSYQTMQQKWQAKDNLALGETILSIEEKNVNILIFTVNGTSINLDYFSNSKEEYQQAKRSPLTWISDSIQNTVLSRLRSEKAGFFIEESFFNNGTYLSLYGQLADNTYIFFDTPREQIIQLAKLSLQFTLITSLLTLLIGVLAAYLLARRFSKPLEHIEKVAQNIALLDFNLQAPISSRDEIGRLGKSINAMSHQLQSYIEKLQAVNLSLNEKLQLEEQTNLMRRQFVANISHDFKTPLALITAYAEAIELNIKAPEDKDACNIIISEAERMNKLITQLLQLSKLESGVQALELSFFSLNDLIQTTLANSEILLAEKHLHSVVNSPTDYLVTGDYRKIEQVLVNLVDNAIKYASENSLITIALTPHETQLRCTITNQGPSISPDDLPNLFASFYRGDKARSLETASFGLGLAIVKAIIDLHHGSYGVANTQDGVEFWFEIEQKQLL